jgi:hypothetical protein
MRLLARHVGLVIVGGALALSTTPQAGATPKCTDVGATVTYCVTNGSTQLTATPPPWNWGGWQGIGFWPGFGGYDGP